MITRIQNTSPNYVKRQNFGNIHIKGDKEFRKYINEKGWKTEVNKIFSNMRRKFAEKNTFFQFVGKSIILSTGDGKPVEHLGDGYAETVKEDGFKSPAVIEKLMKRIIRKYEETSQLPEHVTDLNKKHGLNISFYNFQYIPFPKQFMPFLDNVAKALNQRAEKDEYKVDIFINSKNLMSCYIQHDKKTEGDSNIWIPVDKKAHKEVKEKFKELLNKFS